MMVYLDNAATTPLDKEVFEAMTPYMLEYFGNHIARQTSITTYYNRVIP